MAVNPDQYGPHVDTSAEAIAAQDARAAGEAKTPVKPSPKGKKAPQPEAPEVDPNIAAIRQMWSQQVETR